MDIFEPVIRVFNFIGTLLNTIINGISGVISILTNIIYLLSSLCRLLPNPLYPTFLTFLSLYVVIFTYKIFRQG